MGAETTRALQNVGPRFTPVSFFARPILRRGQAALGGVTGAALSRPSSGTPNRKIGRADRARVAQGLVVHRGLYYEYGRQALQQ